jgi:hypothetical protein
MGDAEKKYQSFSHYPKLQYANTPKLIEKGITNAVSIESTIGTHH